MRVVSICFDDGFRATADKARAIFSRLGWTPCFCILAAPDQMQDPFIKSAQIADWSYWREAQAAGCEIGPHGYAHENLARQPFAEAIDGLNRCFDIFARELPGYVLSEQVFHTAYLNAPPEILAWLCERVRGVRTGLGRNGITSGEQALETRVLDCVSYGHENADRLFSARISKFLTEEQGILTIVLHGLDDEGWGPVKQGTLEAALTDLRRAQIPVVAPGRLLSEIAASNFWNA